MYSREEIFERIFEELADSDVLDFHNCEYEQSKKIVLGILENRLKDYHIIKGDLL